jgi:hypothetical protein
MSSFIVENDDDFTKKVQSSNKEEFIEKSSVKSLQTKDKKSRCYIYKEIKRDVFLQ